MSDNPFDGQLDSGGRTVPRGRLSRLGQFGRLAGGVAGGMVAEGCGSPGEASACASGVLLAGGRI